MIPLSLMFFSKCNVIFALNNYDYESTYSLKRRRFRQQFLKFTSLIKSSFLKNIKKSYLLILTPKRNPSCPNPGRRETILKAFIKPFETPQRSVKMKIYVNFYFNTTFWNAQGREGLRQKWMLHFHWFRL